MVVAGLRWGTRWYGKHTSLTLLKRPPLHAAENQEIDRKIHRHALVQRVKNGAENLLVITIGGPAFTVFLVFVMHTASVGKRGTTCCGSLIATALMAWRTFARVRTRSPVQRMPQWYPGLSKGEVR